MPLTWTQLLDTACAQKTPFPVLLQAQSLATPLEHLAVVSLQGPDARTFLQGQVTCDLNQLSDTQALPGCLCDTKGRVVAHFILFHAKTRYFLILDREFVPLTLKRLTKYAVFSKVKFTDETQRFYFAMQQKTPHPPYTLTLHERVCEIALPSPTPCALMFSEADTDLLRQLDTELLAPQAFFQYKKILAKLVTLTPKTSGLFTPQMLELEKNQGVSFNKGCYLGQEIVARTQHRGTLKRHLQRIEISTTEPVTPGESIVDRNNNQLGTLIESIKLNSTRIALAVIEDRGLNALLSVKGHRICVVR